MTVPIAPSHKATIDRLTRSGRELATALGVLDRRLSDLLGEAVPAANLHAEMVSRYTEVLHGMSKPRRSEAEPPPASADTLIHEEGSPRHEAFSETAGSSSSDSVAGGGSGAAAASAGAPRPHLSVSSHLSTPQHKGSQVASMNNLSFKTEFLAPLAESDDLIQKSRRMVQPSPRTPRTPGRTTAAHRSVNSAASDSKQDPNALSPQDAAMLEHAAVSSAAARRQAAIRRAAKEGVTGKGTGEQAESPRTQRARALAAQAEAARIRQQAADAAAEAVARGELPGVELVKAAVNTYLEYYLSLSEVLSYMRTAMANLVSLGGLGCHPLFAVSRPPRLQPTA